MKNILDKRNKKARDEIDLWKTHAELDKFNYDVATSHYLNVRSLFYSALVAAVVIIIPYPVDYETKILFLIVVSAMLFLIWTHHSKKYQKQMQEHKASFHARDLQITNLYKELGVEKDKLNINHEKLKEIAINKLSTKGRLLESKVWKKISSIWKK